MSLNIKKLFNDNPQINKVVLRNRVVELNSKEMAQDVQIQIHYCFQYLLASDLLSEINKWRQCVDPLQYAGNLIFRLDIIPSRS